MSKSPDETPDEAVSRGRESGRGCLLLFRLEIFMKCLKEAAPNAEQLCWE